MIDYLVNEQDRRRSRRTWVIVMMVLAVSLGALYLFNHGYVSGWLGITIAIAGIAGVFAFLIFLSTKPYGHSDFSFSWRSLWWW